MGSLSLDGLRESHPGCSDEEIARTLAESNGYVAVVRYSSSPGAAPNNLATCSGDDQVEGYFASPYCHDVEILYDARATVIRITADTILSGSCRSCARKTDSNTLVLGAGNDFYFCPRCGLLFCSDCYVRLPLTDGTSGYGTCPDCRVEVKRALPDTYGS